MTVEQAVKLVEAASSLTSLIAVIVAFWALKKVMELRRKLETEYWTKEVIGKTINAKTGKDPKQAEKLQEQILNGDVEEISCDNVKEFCKHIKDNVGNDPLPCTNPMTRQLGVSYVDGGQKFYVSISLTAFKEGQDDLPVKFESDMEASEFLQKLIDHYKKECKK